MKKAVAGLIWAGILFPFFLLALWMLRRGGGGTSEDVSAILLPGLVVICGLAPVGTTVLGLLAMRDAYRERVGGLALGLSLGAAGLFPGLLAVLLVFGGWTLLFGLLFRGLGHILVPALALVASLATAVPLAVWLSSRIWRQANQRISSIDPAVSRGRSRRMQWQPIVLVASQLLVCLFLIALLAAKTAHRRQPVFVAESEVGALVNPATGSPLASTVSVWEMTTNGPAVTDAMTSSMPGGLRDDQKAVLDRALKLAWARYRQMLAENAAVRTNDSGHVVIKLTVHPREIERIESQFWAEVDPGFDRAQQTFLRSTIALRASAEPMVNQEVPLEGPPVIIPSNASPSGIPQVAAHLLCLQGNLVFEYWKVGAWYHWRLRDAPDPDGSWRAIPCHAAPNYRPPIEF